MKTNHFIKGLIVVSVSVFTAVVSAQNTDNGNTYQNTASQPNANTWTGFSPGASILSVGLGLSGSYYYYEPAYYTYPNLILTYDNATFPHVGPGTISLGGLFSYKYEYYDFTNPNTGYYYHQNWNYYVLGFRSAYHFIIPSAPKWDLYAGLMLAYYGLSYNFTSNDPEFASPGDPYYPYYTWSGSSFVNLNAYLGARYFITHKTALWAELGFGFTDLSAGVSFKL
jgi:hypothetical protein